MCKPSPSPRTTSDVATRQRPLTGTPMVWITSIEGSARVWERDPDAVRTIAPHGALTRGATGANGGRALKATGDRFSAAFPWGTATRAMAQALRGASL